MTETVNGEKQLTINGVSVNKGLKTKLLTENSKSTLEVFRYAQVAL